MIPERSLSSPCREKKRLLWAAVSCESLPQPTRHSLGTLWCVSHGTPDSDCPWHPRAQSAYTHLTLRSMGELFTARYGRSGLGSCTPAWAKHFLKPHLLQTLLSLLKTFPAESGESFSGSCPPLWCGCPARGLTRRVHETQLGSCSPLGAPSVTLAVQRLWQTNTFSVDSDDVVVWERVVDSFEQLADGPADGLRLW